MAIILRLDRVMADRKISLNELASRVGISNVNLSNLKTGKVKAVRFSTLDAICDVLDCQPGDILEYTRGKKRRSEGKYLWRIPGKRRRRLRKINSRYSIRVAYLLYRSVRQVLIMGSNSGVPKSVFGSDLEWILQWL